MSPLTLVGRILCLHVAADFGWEDIVQYVIAQGAEVNLPSYKGLLAIQAAAGPSGHLKIAAKILLLHGGDVHAATPMFAGGFPTFAVACNKGNTDIFLWMLENRLHRPVPIATMIVNCEGHDGHAEITDLLLEHHLTSKDGSIFGTPVFCVLNLIAWIFSRS
ncbi:Ankyrin-3 [Paramyrothecium foliicola]|nr:Ankyrin-3 [Paramyrothecium foliicola]